MVDKFAVEKISSLICIELSDDEKEKMVCDLSKILDWMEELDEISIPDDINLMCGDEMHLRKDEVTEKDNREKILENAPQRDRGMFVVPKVVG
jgi:aspartyl-tRNA(Asn)/glutamyl-tRNA(Gln) amidotransferase subunit C